MNINISKTSEYRTRGGKKAIIKKKISELPDHFLFFGYVVEDDSDGDEGHTARAWSENGFSRVRGDGYVDDDIVAIWSEESDKPVVDWSKLPDFIKYVAMDEDGEWYGYTHKPEKCSNCFDLDDEPSYTCQVEIEYDDVPDFDGDWEDSLVERPGLKPAMDIPWDKIPKKFTVVAMEKSGDWFAFMYIPRPYSDREWTRGARKVLRGEGDTHRRLDAFEVTLPKFPGDWKDSIHIRPGADPIKDHA